MSVEDAAQIFLSTPSARRATAQTKLDIAKQAQFLSTPSARRATPFPAGCSGGKKISIHALREEGDSIYSPFELGSLIFLSTPSARRATRRSGPDDPDHQISIHALREEGDMRQKWERRLIRYFYPRPPRGGRLSLETLLETSNLFLSTPSARRATSRTTRLYCLPPYFYPRPPRGGRRTSDMCI